MESYVQDYLSSMKKNMDEQKHQALTNYKLEQIAVRLDKIDSKLDGGDSKYMTIKSFDEFRENEFKPFSSALTRINWIVIVAVISAILYLIIPHSHV